MFYSGLYLEVRGKNFLSETIRPRALIIGKLHHLVDFYQICSNYTPVTKNGPALGVTYFTLVYIGKNMNLLV